MSAIATRKVLAQSFRFVGRNINHVAAAALIPVVLYVVLETIVDLWSPDLDLVERQGRFLAEGQWRFVVWLIMAVFTELVFVPFFVAWHRLTLLATATVHSRTFFGAGKRDLRYCGYFIIILLPLYAADAGITTIAAYLPGAETDGVASIAGLLLGILVFAWLSVRLAFLLVETAIDQPTNLAAAWRATRGHGGPLLVLFVCIMAVELLLALLAVVPELALHGSPPEPWITGLQNLFVAVVTAVLGAVWVSAMSYAYRDATGYRPPDLDTLF